MNMYLCICDSVTDGTVRRVTEAPVNTVKSLCRKPGVAFSGGQCATGVKDCLSDALETPGYADRLSPTPSLDGPANPANRTTARSCGML
ncbi:MAG: hypothetical protein DWQ08_09350 [Proteobacteria bacterium]|nr:MAG: hypothetical protein DWQ08_09350 [Pseudomonadota bacterium]